MNIISTSNHCRGGQSAAKRGILSLLVLLAACLPSWAQDYADHRSEQFATFGTDFWFCAPRTWSGMNQNRNCICIVAQHDCMVTIEMERLGYQTSFPVYGHQTINLRLDTLNFFEMPANLVQVVDRFIYNGPDSALQACYGVQRKGIHLFSTDTIAAFLLEYAAGSMDIVNLLPTHMLRDEYVISNYPEANNVEGSFFAVVAAEDSTIVDIILGGDDWLGRHAGDTFTIMLNQGEMYYDKAQEQGLQDTGYIPNHSFTPHLVFAKLYPSDISNTRIKARDYKRVAVFEGHHEAMVPFMDLSLGTFNGDLLLEQAIPIRYAGKEFLVPNLTFSDTDYLRFTALEDSTRVTITDDSRLSNRTRQMSLEAYQTDWFQMNPEEGPFIITSNKPIILKEVSMGNDMLHGGNPWAYGDPAMVNIKPTSWWNSNPIHHHTVFYVDNNHNMYNEYFETHLFARTVDVPFMRIDDYDVSEHFHPIAGTPYSYAFFDRFSNYNSPGIHTIECTQKGYFSAICDHYGRAIRGIWNLPHIQPGRCYLTVNGTKSDKLREDSIWCLYDPINFKAWSERPADSILWDFGDGTRTLLPYDNGQEVTHTFADTGRYRVMRVIRWRDESEEDCLAGYSAFTRTPDTMYATIWLHNHYDSTINVRLCEGSYFFRGNEYSYTDTFYHTAYWTASGCDTLFTIDLVTCPHCSIHCDTIAPDQLPWTYQGHTFYSPVENYPVHIDIGEDCDSIIQYYLVVLKHWGEPPLDSIIILAPNIFTPNGESNQAFHIVTNKHISALEVSIFERQGMLVTRYNGLTHDWDGTKEGRPMKQGAYVYYIRYMDSKVNGWKTMKGSVTLIR